MLKKPVTTKPLIVTFATMSRTRSNRQERPKKIAIFSSESNRLLVRRKNGNSNPFITPKRSAAINKPAKLAVSNPGNTQKPKPIPMTLINNLQANALMLSSHFLFVFYHFFFCLYIFYFFPLFPFQNYNIFSTKKTAISQEKRKPLFETYIVCRKFIH